MRIVAIASAILISIGMSACENEGSVEQTKPDTTAADVKKEVQEAVDTLGEFSEARSEEYQKLLHAKLETLEQKHDTLETKTHAMGRDAEEEVQATLKELQSKKEAIKTEIGKLENSTEEAWEEMGTGIEKAMSELEEGYDRALKEFE